MKRTFKTISVLMLMCTMVSGCQKEYTENDVTAVEQSFMVHISYIVDGTMYSTFVPQESIHLFYARIFALARNGHVVTVCGSGSTNQQTESKEKIVFHTSSETEALTWAEKMRREGYDVTIEFDSSTGIYTCTATN